MDTVRLSIKLEKGKPIVEAITGTRRFEDNKNDVYSYACPHKELLNIITNIVDGDDCSGSMLSFLRNDGHLVLKPSLKVEGGPSSIAYSKMECTILQQNTFSHIVEPTIGTVVRSLRVGKNKINGIYLSDDEDPQSKLAYINTVKQKAIEIGVDFEYTICQPGDIMGDNVYFGSLGHMMHNYYGRCMGLELNPYVAAKMGNIIAEIVRFGDYYKVSYFKNMDMKTYRYYHRPAVYRYHGADFMTSSGVASMPTFNVYNVVSSDILPIKAFVAKIADDNYNDFTDVVTIPEYTSRVQGELTLAIDRVGVVVDVLEPKMEVSSRLSIVNELTALVSKEKKKYRVSRLNGNHYSIYSVPQVGNYYKRIDVPFPCAWYYDGSKWVVRAYPYAENRNHMWFNKGVLIDKSDWYNGELILRKGIYRVTSDKTTLLVPADEGDPYFTVKVSNIPQFDKLVVVTKGDVLELDYHTKEQRGQYCVYRFQSFKARTTFVMANRGRGCVVNAKYVPDYKYKTEFYDGCTYYIKHFSSDAAASMQLSDVDLTLMYDVVGNYIGDYISDDVGVNEQIVEFEY